MIFVDRSAVPVPEILASPRADAARQKIARLLSSSSRAHLDQLRITFDSQIWVRAKEALLQLFNGKCAYCESNITLTAAGDIEHFRPKQGAEDLMSGRVQHYYAWLAYEWDNLLIICAMCNQKGKRAAFPVAGPRAPVLASVEECRTKETALLIDPCFDQPSEHLAFDRTGICRGLSEKGNTTINLLHLNRPNLTEARRQAWALAQYTLTHYANAVASLREDEAEEAQKRIVELRSVRHEYSAVVGAAIEEFRSRMSVELDLDASARSVLADARTRSDLSRITEVPSPHVEEMAPVEPEATGPALAPPPPRYPGRYTLPPFAHQRILRIEIRNFKAIAALDFDLPEPPSGEDIEAGALMLIGENAAGKSTVLEAIALALLGVNQITRIGISAQDCIPRTEAWNTPAPDSGPTEIRIHFEGMPTPVTLTIDLSTGEFRGNQVPATVLLGYGPRRFFAKGLGLRRSRHAAARAETLFDPLATITNPTGWLTTCRRPLFDASIRALRQILVLPDEAVVERPQASDALDAEIMFEVQGTTAPINRLSEGYKTILATGVDIMREMLRYWPDLETARGVVLIDELETHLHPRWKMRIVQRLRRAMPRVQFIATTHDPLCLRGLYDGEVHVLQRDEAWRIQKVTDLPNVRGLTVEQLLTSEFFGLFSTEDPAVEEDLMRYVALASKHDRTPDDERELEAHRQTAKNKLRLGTTPASEIVQDAVSEYLLRRRQVPSRERGRLKREAIEKVLDYWKSLDVKDASR